MIATAISLAAVAAAAPATTATAGIDALSNADPTPAPLPTQLFGFGYAFGDDMVLQQAPAKAAVYGFLSDGGTAVKVTVSQNGVALYSVDAEVGTDATHQAYGGAFGTRPCAKADCPPYDMAGWNPFNKPLSTWKALLKPTAAVALSAAASAANGPYTITATCTGCAGNATETTDALSGVVFGDMWYCSGQSNMWLPVDHSFSRNNTADAIAKGKYTNVRGMFGVSSSIPSGAKGTFAPGGRGYGRKDGSNPWMTAAQAIATGAPAASGGTYPLFRMGAACWYFGQRLSELGVDVPIGLADTAIGGQRIEEYMNNATIGKCSNRSSEDIPWWNGQLFATQVIPFVDMTVKGWVWYQGENNMGAPKGNSLADLGYSCEQRELIRGWREVWSETPGTTDPLAPFGVVTLASSGAEGADAAMGAMRIAQTAGYGVLPSPELPNTFLAQAYDLDDAWGPAMGPCFDTLDKPRGLQCCNPKTGAPAQYPLQPPAPSPASAPLSCSSANWLNQTLFVGQTAVAFGANATGVFHAESAAECCAACANATLQSLGCAYWNYHQDRGGPKTAKCSTFKDVGNYSTRGPYSKWETAGPVRAYGPVPGPTGNICSAANLARCATACAAVRDTPVAMGGIHPRSKKFVGDRLGTAAFNTVYGGKGAATGPTLSSCSLSGGKLTVRFNASLLAGDRVVLQKYAPNPTPPSGGKYEPIVGGSYLDVQTSADNFCMEDAHTPAGELYCPTWAGGTGKPVNTSTQLDGGWTTGLDIALSADGGSIVVDLAPLNGTTPTAVRYAWSIVSCCDLNDPDTYVTKPCVASCPIMSSSSLPANPFLAKIVDGKCECIAPQVCS